MTTPTSGRLIDRSVSRRTLGLTAGAALASGSVTRRSRESSSQEGGWRQIDTGEVAPPARWDHTLAAYDDGRELVLFGGRDGAGTPVGDTWRFSRSDEHWELLDTSGPSPRFGHAVATDQARGVLYLFGGQAGSEFYSDLWQFDLTTGAWTLLADGSGASITPRYGTSMVLTDEGSLVVSHGFTFDGRFDDTWSFDLDTCAWSEISPESDLTRPLKRCLHESVWADNVSRMLLFGGCSSGFGPCPQGDLWSFEPQSRSWTDRTVEAAPSARSNPSLVYDGGRERVLLFGGLTDQGYAADFWSLSLPSDDSVEPSIWTRLAQTGPTPRASHDAVMTGPWLYLFGGYGDVGVLGDFWVLDVRVLEPA